MSIEPAATPERKTARSPLIVMPGGGPVPSTEEEMRAHAAKLAQGLEAIAQIGDEEEQAETLAFLMEALNADRMSYRARFP